jgi:tRNA A-37 threonylcarbamoyl transferase component Bud32
VSELFSTWALPRGFVHRADERGHLAVRAELLPELIRSGWGLGGEGTARASELSGRAPLSELELAGQVHVVRRFTHGGLLRWLTGARFREPERPFRELSLAEELARLGLPTPRLVAARALRSGAGTWKLDVVSEKVEGALDLAHALARGGLARGERARLVAACGALVARMHACGLLHADLTPRNLLVERSSLGQGAGEVRLWILDLDRSTVRAGLSPEERTRNLRRLYRHVARLSAQGKLDSSRAELWRFLAAYEPKREARKALSRAILSAHRRSLLWHRAGWALERQFGQQVRDPQPRERRGPAS